MTPLPYPADQRYLDDLRRKSRSILAAVLAGAREVVLAGVPRHRNLGDSMIAAGTLSHLRVLGVRATHVWDPYFSTIDRLLKVPNSVPILLNGGGNLGDLYPHEEAFRQQLFTNFPDRRFIIMPQTVHFESAAEMQKSRDAYALVGNLTVMTRDKLSLAIAREMYPAAEVVWSPDHALGWDPGPRKNLPKQGLTVVARADREGQRLDILNSADWSFKRSNNIVWNSTVKGAYYYRHLPGSRIWGAGATSFTMLQTRINLAAAERIASNCSALATNRLHAHVLSVLTGRPHAVTDNNYGKISRIFQEYTGAFSTANWAPTLGDAIEVAQRLVPRP